MPVATNDVPTPINISNRLCITDASFLFFYYDTTKLTAMSRKNLCFFDISVRFRDI